MSIYDKATNPYHRSGLEGSGVLLPAVGTLTQRAAPFILQPKRKIMTTLLPCLLLVASGLRQRAKNVGLYAAGLLLRVRTVRNVRTVRT